MNSHPSPSIRHCPARSGLILAAVLFLFAAVPAARAQSEDGIKAAFLFNFAKFTEWPSKAFANDNAPITVGFIGAESLAALLEKNVTGKNINGRELAVKRLTGTEGIENCQILFIGDPGQISSALAAAKGKPILTVGNSEDFSSAGGMINFIKEGAKVTFDLNLNAIEGVNLSVDGKIRQLARSAKGG